MLYSLKSFVTRISPVTSDFFNSYTTSQYKLSFYETASGVKFVMNTDLGATYINEVLKSLYSKVRTIFWQKQFYNFNCMARVHFLTLDHQNTLSQFNTVYQFLQVYVEYSVKNPLVTMGTMIDSELFKSQVDNFITAQQIFRWCFYQVVMNFLNWFGRIQTFTVQSCPNTSC